MLLEKLCNARGVSGDENEVRSIILDAINPYCDSIKIDNIGNVIAYKKGSSSEKKVMVSAHMDEIGFIVSDITEKGYIKFKTVGGIDPRVIISKRVLIGENAVAGVIGIKAIHLQEKSERENGIKLKQLAIDIGAKNKDEALALVSIGDYICFEKNYADFGDHFIKSKAIDDRVGCYILVELLKNSYECDLYACFTVQEEVGLRGAIVASYTVEPDLALVLEATTAADVYGVKNYEYVASLDKGAVVTLMDRHIYIDKKLALWLYENGKKKGIDVQYKEANTGGNDAGAIHISRRGVKTCSISLACRYIHSPVSVISKKDIESTLRLAKLFLENAKGLM